MKHLLALCLVTVPLHLAQALPQCPEWSQEFNARGVDGDVYTILRHDDGAGEKLYIGGQFNAVGDVLARNIAVWDGSSWSAVGESPLGPVRALAVYDDGTGPALYAGTSYTWNVFPYIGRYDGSSWTSVPVDGDVLAMHVHDDGNGSALYVGGEFQNVDGVYVRGLARYDGTWERLPGEPWGHFRALETHDDGSGPKLFAAGSIASVADPTIRDVLSWDGSAIAGLGGANLTRPIYFEGPFSLQSFDGDLYVGGQFTGAGSVESTGWIRWTSSGWEGLPFIGYVHDFAIRTGGDGSQTLFMAVQSGVRRLGSTGIVTEVGGTSAARAVEAFDTGTGERLFVGRDSSQHDGLLQWVAGAWQSVVPGGAGVDGGWIRTLVTHDLGSGPRLVAGGTMTSAGGTAVDRVAVWDGAWSPLGSGLFGAVYALAVFDDGSGATLYATGSSLGVGPSQNLPLARFDGAGWQPLGSSLGSDRGDALVTFREGAQESLFLGGNFYEVEGLSGTSNIVRWDGNAWSSVGGGIGGNDFYDGVTDMLLFDDGSGEALYAAGQFDAAGGVPVHNIARWDGSSWSALGSGLERVGGSVGGCLVCDLEVWQSPQGEALVATGLFDTAGGAPAQGVAVWDGTSWSTLGGGLPGVRSNGLSAKGFDPDGGGERLFVVNNILPEGIGLSTRTLATWDGASWSEVDVVGWPSDMAEHDDGTGRALYLGGALSGIDGVVSVGLARLADTCGADIGIPRCAARTNSTGLAGRVRADGSSSVAAEDLNLSARDLPPGAPTLFFHGPLARRIPFGDGLRCAGGSLKRIYPIGLAVGGTYDLQLDFAAPYAADLTAGTTHHFQGWYRDGMGGPAGFNTTDALEITFRP